MGVAEAASITSDQSDEMVRFSEGLEVLIRFHDRELDQDTLSELLTHRVAEGFTEFFAPDSTGAKAAEFLSETLADVGPAPEDAVLDEMAVDFADLYLTHGYRVSPNGSVWLTEDKLERQLPMFDVRDWYEHYSISVPDWRIRADDHIVHEFQFVAFLCRLGTLVSAQDAGRFLDLHVLPWVPEFCLRARDRVRHPVYAAVMQLSLAFLEELRASLERITGEVRQVRDVRDLDTSRSPEPDAEPYMPGMSESW